MNKTLTQRLTDVAAQIYRDSQDYGISQSHEYYAELIFDTVEEAGYAIVRKVGFGDLA